MTNQRDGKIVFVVRLQVTPDGKAIHASSESKEDDSVKTWELHKNLNRLFLVVLIQSVLAAFTPWMAPKARSDCHPDL